MQTKTPQRAILPAFVVATWIFVGLAFPTSSCVANWLPNGTPVCNVAAFDVIAGAVVDGSQIAFVWSTFPNGDVNHGEIRVRRMNVDGTSVPGWPQGGLWMGDTKWGPTSVCPDEDGGVITVWASFGDSALVLSAQRMNRVGDIAAGWPRTGVLISTTVRGSAAIAPDGNGGVFVVWDDMRHGWQDPDVYLQRISGSGSISAGWPGGGVPVCTAEGAQDLPQVSSDGEGGAFVAWTDGRSGSSRVYVSRITASGELAAGWVSDGTPASTGTSFQVGSQIAGDGSGGLFVAWDDWRPPTGNCCLGNAYAQHFEGDGSIHPGWSPAGNRVCNFYGGQEVRSIVSDGADGVFILWMDFRDGTPVSDNDLYSTRINSDGTVVSGWPDTGLPLCTRPGGQYPGSMVYDGQGGFWVSWHEAPLGTYDYNVYVQHVALDGSLFGIPDGSPVCTASGMQVSDRLALIPGGGAVVAWEDGRAYKFAGDDLIGGDSDIFATVVSDQGEPKPSARPPIAFRAVRPNPSHGASEVLFDLDHDGPVRSHVFDVVGRRIRTLLDAASYSAGANRLLWDGKDDQGRHVPSGVYFIRVESGGRSETRPLVLLRR